MLRKKRNEVRLNKSEKGKSETGKPAGNQAFLKVEVEIEDKSTTQGKLESEAKSSVRKRLVRRGNSKKRETQPTLRAQLINSFVGGLYDFTPSLFTCRLFMRSLILDT